MEISSGLPYFSVSKIGILIPQRAWCLVITLLVTIFSSSLSAQEEINLSSPYHSVRTHLLNLQEDQYFPDYAYKPFDRKGLSTEAAKEAAIRLKRILDGKGILIDLEEIPKETDYFDSSTHQHRYFPFPEYPDIYLEKSGIRWYYSRESIAYIDFFYNKTFPFRSDQLMDLIPRFGSKKFLGLFPFQWGGLLLYLVISFVIYLFFSLIFRWLIYGFVRKILKIRESKKSISKVANPSGYFMVNMAWILFLPALQLPAWINHYLHLFLNSIWPVFLIIIFYNLTSIFSAYLAQLALKTESTLDDQLVPLTRKILQTIVIISGILIILINLNISVIPFITGLSIGGLALALAAQDTIKNVFGSMMIFIDKPFQIGHWITSGEIDGEVEEVGLRSTRIRTFRNSLTYVPNGKLADSIIDNHGMRAYRRYYTTLNITYDTPPRLISLFIEGLNRLVENHPGTRKDKYHIFANDLGPHSIHIMFYIFFMAPTWADELRFRHEMILQILELADRLQVRFAFPTRTIQLDTGFGKNAVISDLPANSEEMKRKTDPFFDETSEKV